MGWSWSVNVVGPGLDLFGSPLALGLGLVLVVATELPGEKPTEEDGHAELDHDDAQNDNEGGVEDDIRGLAAYSVGVDATNADDVDKTIDRRAVVGFHDLHGDILAFEGAVADGQLVVEFGVHDLRAIEPVEQVKVEDMAVEDTEVSTFVAHLLPGVEDLTFSAHAVLLGVVGVVKHASG